MPMDYPKITEAAKDVIAILRIKHKLTYEECEEALKLLQLSLIVVQTPKEAQ